MKKRANGLKKAAVAAQIADRILTGIMLLLVALAILCSGYAVWDSWMIYHNASVSSDLLKYKPDITDDAADNPSLADLQKINPDVCAWLTVDDTNIDYPVVQGVSNMEYINKDVYGEFSMSGSVFLDYRNARDFSDHYSLIYAHHMEGNVMFGELTEFEKESYFQSHTGGSLCTPDDTFIIEWFACLHTDAYDYKVFNPDSYDTEEENEDLLSYIKTEAVQYRELDDLVADDQIIALSTCSDLTTNGRTLLFGRMVKVENNRDWSESEQ
jgi:sortase B